MHLLHRRNRRNVSLFDLHLQNLTPTESIENQLILLLSDLTTEIHS